MNRFYSFTLFISLYLVRIWKNTEMIKFSLQPVLLNKYCRLRQCFLKEKDVGQHISSHSQMFFKIVVLKNFANFIGKHLCWSLVFFYQGFLSRTLTTHRTAGEGRDHLIPLYHFHPLTNIQTFICNFAREMTITYF